MRKQGIIALILIIQTVIAGNVWGQSHLSEPLSRGSCHLIEYAELIGTLKNVHADNFENIPGNTIRRHLFSLEANVSLFNE